MDAVLSGTIAVVGTLLGSLVTYIFQRRSAERARQIARGEQLRQERLAAYSDLAGAVIDLRRAAIDRWHREQEDPTGKAYSAARGEYYRLYTVARTAHIRLRLLSADTELIDHGHRAVKIASDIHDAKTELGCTEPNLTRLP
jgi:hypothetical protein